MSLEQITRLIAQDTSADDIRAMLTLRKAQIEQTVQAEMARLRVVESRLQQIDAHGQIQASDVVLKAVPAQPFLALREVLPDMDAVRRLVQRISAIVPAKVGQHSLDQIAVVLHSPLYDPEALDLEIGYRLTGKAPASIRLSEERILTLRELPAINTLATLVHVGQVNNTHQTYGLLAQWIEQNQWQISGKGREILMQLPVPGKTEEVVFELQFPVSKIGEKLGA